MREALRSLGLLLATAVRADSWRSAGVFAVTVFESGTRVTRAFFLKVLVDGAVEGEIGAAVFVGVGFGVTLALLGYLNILRINWSQILREKTAFALESRAIEATTAIPTIEHHERPEYLEKVELLRAHRQGLGAVVSALSTNLQVLLIFVGLVGLLQSVHPVLMLLPLFGAPAVWLSAKSSKMVQQAAEETAESSREAAHVFTLTTTAAPGKELRIFGLGNEMVRRFEKAWDYYDRHSARAARKAAAYSAAGWAFFAVGFVGSIVFVVDRAIADPQSMSVGDVVLTMGVASQLHGLMGGLSWVVGWLTNTLRIVSRLLWVEDHARAVRREIVPDSPEPVPPSVEHGLRFEGVGFSYPGTDRPVLEGVDFLVPAGTTVAIVGENGAGKTTLVKLLCGFYRPTSGRITLDGVDLAAFDPAEWRGRLSAGFQDFAKFELLARETIGIGQVGLIDDADAVTGALDKARQGEILHALPQGLETQLGKSFTNGVELSVGQWQKLALGRTMMREGPLVMVLDEPTASLDAQTEHDLFERYAAASQAGAANGAITVLVSHRFSTVRMADLIVVVDGGGVVEVGDHAALVALGGVYADLYELQARAYR